MAGDCLIRKKLLRACLAAAFVAVISAAAPGTDLNSSATPTKTDRVTLQRLFDEANKSFEAQNWEAAARGFTLFREASGPSRSEAVAVAAVRQGHALIQLGKYRAAISALETGLGNFPSSIGLASDHILGLQDLATANERDQQFASAAIAYRKLLPIIANDRSATAAALLGFARVSMFEDPSAAIEAANSALAIKVGNARDLAKLAAAALDLRGRAELISGRKTEAIATFQEAMRRSGGMTLRLDELDANIRADLGLAYLLDGQDGLAHRYFAATGTASQPGGFLPSMTYGASADCDKGQSPADIVIIELSIGPDGTPRNVWPIYTSRIGTLASAVVGAAKSMKWTPAKLTKLQSFYAQTVRLEAHCAMREVEDKDLPWEARPARHWVAQSASQKYSTESLRLQTDVSAARAELARRERQFGIDSIELMPVLLNLSESRLVEVAETRTILDRAMAIAQKAGAPVAVLADFEIERSDLSVDGYIAHAAAAQMLLKREDFANDLQASSYLKYVIGLELGAANDESGVAMLRVVAADPRLSPDDPIRRAANLRLFYNDWRTKGSQQRLDYLRAAQVAGDPCRVYRWAPANQPPSSLYPPEARRWNFEGWAMVDLDLRKDGTVSAMRPDYVYPPLIFAEAAKRTAGALAFKIVSGSVPKAACNGYTTVFHFQLKK